MDCAKSIATVRIIQEHKETQTTPGEHRKLNHETTSLTLIATVQRGGVNNGNDFVCTISSISNDEEALNADTKEDDTNDFSGPRDTLQREEVNKGNDFVPTKSDASISDDVEALSDYTKVDDANNSSGPKVVAQQKIKHQEITESDIQKQIENHRWREKLNAETLEKQRNLTRIRLQETLEERRKLKQTKVGDKMQTTTKEVLYSGNSTDLFSELEDYAIRLKPSNVSFSELMENLFIRDLSDLEKVRILFHWISSQDLNSISFPNDLNPDSPLGYLQQIKTEKKSYPSLFVRLCSAAGLFAKEIKGYVKGHGYYPDHKFSSTSDQRGTWNAVLLGKQWRLIDTHWGARSIIGEEEDEDTAKSKNLVYEYEEYYFLTDPEHLITTHFPDDTVWQLLPVPITLAHFEDNVKQWPLFSKLKLSLISHKSGVIHADQHGHVQIKLGVPPFARGDADFYGELKLRNKRSEKFPRYVLHYANNDTEVFDVFLPHPGKYLFYVFAKSTKFKNRDEECYNWICLYQIECSKVTAKPSGLLVPPFFENALCYGPSKKMSDVRVHAISHPGPTVECDGNGEATLKFSFAKSRMPIYFIDDMKDINSAEVDNSVVRSVERLVTNDMALFVFVRVPANGKYCLTLFYRDGEGSSDTHSAFVKYLIVSQKQSSKSHILFPEIQSLGPRQSNFDDLSLAISTDCGSSLSQHWLAFKQSGECTVFIEHAESITLLAELKSTNEEYDKYVLVATDKNNSVISLRAPPTIADRRSILALHIFAAPRDTSDQVPRVYSALISGITEYNQSTQAFIPPPSNRWGFVTSKEIQLNELSVKFINSDPAVQQKKLQADTFPYRRYGGGDDFKIELQTNEPMHFLLKFLICNANESTEKEEFIMISKSSHNKTTIQARFPEAGMYRLSIFAKSLKDTGNSYSPRHHTLIEALVPSKCETPFPKSYALWNASCCELFTPLEGKIKRNIPAKFRLKLAKYSATKIMPYGKVLLFLSGGQTQEPTKSGPDFVYEWDYISGPSDSNVSVVIKEKPDDTTVKFVLQFEVI